MNFIWPNMLLALFVPAALLVLYIFLKTGNDKVSKPRSTFELIREAQQATIGWRKHVPPALFLVGITLLSLSLARPEMMIRLPRIEGTVILAFDVSSSMLADDFEPTRLDAAKAAAATFVDNQPSTIRVGVVAFSNGGLSVQPPTNVKADITAAIDRLTPIGATSLGQGIFVAVNTLAFEADPEGRELSDEIIVPSGDEPLTGETIPSGLIPSSAIVLLTDGENTTDPDPLEIAELAAERGVPIYTIGIGSPDGATLEVDGFSVFTALNEGLLIDISEITSGAYYNAQNEAELEAIYDQLDTRLVVRGEDVEITAFLSLAAVLTLLIGATLSLLWFGRAP